MRERTRQRLNSLRRPMLDIAIGEFAKNGHSIDKQVAYAAGLGDAIVHGQEQKAKARAKNRVARASRKVNRQRRKAGLPA